MEKSNKLKSSEKESSVRLSQLKYSILEFGSMLGIKDLTLKKNQVSK